MIEEKRDRGEQPEEQVNIQEILFRYLIHWPWFVVSVIICIACAWGYLRLATPVYDITATVLIKDDKKGGGASMSSELEKMGLDGFVSSSNNVDNEIEVLKSKSLAREVVNNLGLFVTYKDEDLIPSKELYKTSPVQVNMTPQEAEKLKKDIVVEMVVQPQGSLDVNVKMDDREIQKHFEKLPAVFPTDKGTLAFFLTPDSVLSKKILEKNKGFRGILSESYYSSNIESDISGIFSGGISFVPSAFCNYTYNSLYFGRQGIRHYTVGI